MYILPTSNYLRRNLLVTHRTLPVGDDSTTAPADNRKRILKELQDLGVTWWGRSTMETNYLPKIIHPNEHIGGVVYGHNEAGFAMLIATDRRIVFLDKKPLFVKEEEVDYHVVGGVSYSDSGLIANVTLYTRVKNFTIWTFNTKCAKGFVKYIEERSLEHNNGRGSNDDPAT